METKHFNDAKKGFFKAYVEGNEAGMTSYIWSSTDTFIIDHTEVNPDFLGKGIGKQLVMEAAEYARKNNLKIIPLCSFAKGVFDKVIEIQDVLS